MKLSELLQDLPAYNFTGSADEREIVGLAYDSRQVQPGYLFVAIPGTQADGHDFVAQAVARGAVAVIAQRVVEVPEQVALIVTDNTRRALAAVSAAYYDHPDQKLRLIGVTGTNGKTTTVNLVKYLLERAGHKCGLISTVGCRAGDKPLPDLLTASTTPEPLELFRLLALMAEQGCDYAVMEVSSHALAQGRTSACRFAGAVFTNLTQDHLDYHHTMDEYCRAKTLLFAQLDPLDGRAFAVLNSDDAYAGRFRDAARCRVFSYGASERSDLRIIDTQASMHGMECSLHCGDERLTLRIPLMGRFNVYNSLAALAVAQAEGVPLDVAVAWMADAPQVPGRFELVREGQDFAVVVDYAHTPDGLENLLNAARALEPQRLICVFGCGGDRDNKKRPIMGRLSGQLADVSIITSDNPRTEDPQRIIDMVEEGVSDVTNNYLVEPDRAQAINMAINMAGTGDMVLLAGKGHEDYQLINGVKHHFDDREVARAALLARLHK